MRTLRIGTRGSDLARRQSEQVRQRILALGQAAELVFIHSAGDRAPDAPFDTFEGVGFFSAELERALLAGEVDLAVHSHKDLPTVSPEGLLVGAIPEREDPREVLLVHPDAWAEGAGPLPLAPGATLGTSSARRAALARALAPETRTVPIRGNVPTRIQKARDGGCGAVLLAAAGLRRLGFDPEAMPGLRSVLLDARLFPPAPAQGALAIQLRAGDQAAREVAASLDHAETARAVRCERELLALLGGGCSVPLGCLARVEGGALRLRAAYAPAGELRRGEAVGEDPSAVAALVHRAIAGGGAP